MITLYLYMHTYARVLYTHKTTTQMFVIENIRCKSLEIHGFLNGRVMDICFKESNDVMLFFGEKILNPSFFQRVPSLKSKSSIHPLSQVFGKLPLLNQIGLPGSGVTLLSYSYQEGQICPPPHKILKNEDNLMKLTQHEDDLVKFTNTLRSIIHVIMKKQMFCNTF